MNYFYRPPSLRVPISPSLANPEGQRTQEEQELSWKQKSCDFVKFCGCLLGMILCSTSQASADTFGLFTYTEYSTYIEITDYPETATGTVAVPETIAGKPVKSIGSNAFYSCEGLTSVTLPASVTYIGYQAFAYCEGLTNMVIPTSVTSIEDRAFYRCFGLTNMIIPSGVVSIGGWAFSQCIGLTSVTVSSTVNSVGTNAFGSCSSLTNISVDPANSTYSSTGGVLFDKSGTALLQLPAGVSGPYEFSPGVTIIGDYALDGCSELTSLTIPAGVTSIGAAAFRWCDKLTAFTVSQMNSSFATQGGVLFNKTGTTLVAYPPGRVGAYTVPNGVTSIGDGAFPYCYGLTGVTMPMGLTRIGKSAFSSCYYMTYANIPSSVTSIESGAFAACYALASATIPFGVTRIEGYVFQQCFALASVTIPTSVTSIGGSAFGFCRSLGSVSIPPGVTSIEDDTFYDCGSLKNAFFLGNAPTMSGALSNLAPGFTSYFFNGKTGFSTPTWQRYPAVNIGAPVPFIVMDQRTGIPLRSEINPVSVVSAGMGTNSDPAFTILNTGATDLTGIVATIGGAGASQFSVITPPASSLVPNGSATFVVRYSPTATGSHIASLSIANSIPSASPFTIQLIGNSVSPQSQLFTGSGSITVPSSGNALPYPSLINVSGVPNGEKTLQVKINGLSHSYPDDLDIFLMAPNGSVAALMSDCGGVNGVSNINLTFSDSATGSLPDSSTITSGTYRPTNIGASEALPPGGTGTIGTSLASLTNGTINGTWKLFVTDDESPDLGRITSWSLELATIPGNSGGPTGGTMAFSPSSHLNPSTTLNVSFSDWTQASPPLSYAVLVNGTVVSAQGSSPTRNITAPSTSGTYTLVGRIYDSLNNVREVSQTIIVNTPQQSFTNTMTLAGLTTSNALPSATPHNDGVQNLLKYAFNMNLSGPDVRRLVPGTGTQGLPSVTSITSGATTTLRVEFIRRRNSGLLYTPKRSSDFTGGSWLALTDVPTVSTVDTNWERVVYEETLPTASNPRCFGVVEVTLP